MGGSFQVTQAWVESWPCCVASGQALTHSEPEWAHAWHGMAAPGPAVGIQGLFPASARDRLVTQ